MALAWPNHIHHERARTWFAGMREGGWATCPLTESGFVRVSSNTRVIPDARSPREVIALLTAMRGVGGHVFWTDDVSPTGEDCPAFSRIVGYRQVTDAHLLTLAERHGGAVATFDRGMRELAADGPQVVVIE